jgi:hypothetical protein
LARLTWYIKSFENKRIIGLNSITYEILEPYNM